MKKTILSLLLVLGLCAQLPADAYDLGNYPINPDGISMGAPAGLVVATGAVTVSGKSNYTIDTEASAATDELDTILPLREGVVLYLQNLTGARVTTLTDGVGNIVTQSGVNFALPAVGGVFIEGTATTWVVLNGPTGVSASSVTAAAVITDNAIVRGDGGAKGIQDSGVLIDDTDNITGVVALTATGAVTGDTLASTVAIGTAPFTVTSTTVVPNLNASLLEGNAASSFAGATHAASHTDGTDDIQDATSSQKGLATAAQIYKLDNLDTASASALKLEKRIISSATDTSTITTSGTIIATQKLDGTSSYTSDANTIFLYQANNNLTDESSYGRTITNNNAATWSAAIKTEGTHSVEFTNATQNYLSVPSDAAFSFPGTFTFEGSINLKSAVLLHPIFGGAAFHDGGIQTFAFTVQQNTAVKLFFGSQTTSELNQIISIPYVFSLGTWYHIAVIRDADDTLKLYVDGDLIYTQAGFSGTITADPLTTLYMGYAPTTILPAANEYADAYIDRVRISNIDRPIVSSFIQSANNLSEIVANTAKVTNATHTGDATGSTALTIAADAVTYAKMQNVVSDQVLLGNISGAGGAVSELTAAQSRTLLNVANGAIANVVEDTTPQLGGFLDTNSNQIRESRGIDVASVDPLVLGTDGNSFDITGTTTITGITSIAAGTVVRLQFDGALQLTHGTIILPGAANITTAAGDVAYFEDQGANVWRCLTYTKADGTAVVGSGGGGGTTQPTDVNTYNIRATNEGATAGDTRGEYSVDLQTIRTAVDEVAAGDYSVLSGGKDNISLGTYAAVGGGLGNEANNFYATVPGGDKNTVAGQYGVVSGGGTNTAGGKPGITISGGLGNNCQGQDSTIGGGNTNTVTSTGDQGFIGGGDTNLVSSLLGAIVGGLSNTASGARAFIGAGQSNTASAQGTVISGGSTNAASGDWSTVPGGKGNIANANYAVASGWFANATLLGQHASGSGRFSVSGDAQTSELIARASVAAAGPTELFLDGSATKLTIASNRTYTFTVTASAVNTNGLGTGTTGDCAGYKLEGVIKNVAGTTSLVGGVAKTIIAEDVPAWDFTVTADDVTDYLKLEGTTGDASSTIRFVAKIELVETAW